MRKPLTEAFSVAVLFLNSGIGLLDNADYPQYSDSYFEFASLSLLLFTLTFVEMPL